MLKLCTSRKFETKQDAAPVLKEMKKQYPHTYRAYSIEPCNKCSGWHIQIGIHRRSI